MLCVHASLLPTNIRQVGGWSCLVGLRGELLYAGLVIAEQRHAEVLRVVVRTPRHLRTNALS